jgi:hypothetical protein
MIRTLRFRFTEILRDDALPDADSVVVFDKNWFGHILADWGTRFFYLLIPQAHRSYDEVVKLNVQWRST